MLFNQRGKRSNGEQQMNARQCIREKSKCWEKLYTFLFFNSWRMRQCSLCQQKFHQGLRTQCVVQMQWLSRWYYSWTKKKKKPLKGPLEIYERNSDLWSPNRDQNVANRSTGSLSVIPGRVFTGQRSPGDPNELCTCLKTAWTLNATEAENSKRW